MENVTIVGFMTGYIQGEHFVELIVFFKSVEIYHTGNIEVADNLEVATNCTIMSWFTTLMRAQALA